MSVDLATLALRVDALEVKNADRELQKLEKTGAKLEGTAKNLEGALKRAFLGLSLVSITTQAIRLADTYSNMQGRLGLVTKGTDELAVVTERLYGVAQRTRVGFEATVDLYSTLARSTKALGVSQVELLQVTESVSQALIISGANAASSEAALRQLGQGFASGALRGDELNSVLENTPRLAQAIAEGMGVTVGQLRKLGAEGKITASSVLDALVSQQAVLEAEFARMPKTVGQTLTQLGNSILMFVGEADKSIGVTNALAGAISLLAENVDKAGIVFGVVAGALLLSFAPAVGAAAVGATAATVAFVSTTAATIAAIPGQLAFSAALLGTSRAGAAAAAGLALLRTASVALLGVGLIGAVLAIVGAFVYLKNAMLDSAEAADLVKNANEGYMGALQNVASYQERYGLSVDGTNKLMDEALGITAQTNAMADTAAAAALRRAAAERQLTIDILNRRAAEMQESAEKLQTSAMWNRVRGRAQRFGAQLDDAVGLDGSAIGQYQNATESFNNASQQEGMATNQYRAASSLSRLAVDLGNDPLTPAPARVASAGVPDKPKRSARSSAISDEQRELERATKAAEDYAKMLTEETAEMGLNQVQTRMLTAEREAAAAPNEALAKSIRDAATAWKVANDNAATNELLLSMQDLNAETAFENSLMGKNARERATAIAQREIDIKLRDLERQGIAVNTDAIQAETEAFIANATARGQLDLNAEKAREFSDAMSDANSRIQDAVTGLSDLAGQAGETFGNLISLLSDYGDHQAEVYARIAETEARYGEDSTEANRERQRSTEELANAEIDHYGNMLSAAKGFFDEKSTAYKVLQAAETAYRLYQFAMAVQAMFFDTAETTSAVANAGVRMGVDAAETTSSVAKSGIRAAADGVAAFAKTLASLPFPFNIAAGAVVLAALVGVGVAMSGKGKSGASGGGGTAASAIADDKPTSYTPFISHDLASASNDNRRYAPISPNAYQPAAGQASGSRTNVFDFTGANFSNADPEAVKAAVRSGIQEATPDILADARQQSVDDMASMSRQRLGG